MTCGRNKPCPHSSSPHSKPKIQKRCTIETQSHIHDCASQILSNKHWGGVQGPPAAHHIPRFGRETRPLTLWQKRSDKTWFTLAFSRRQSWWNSALDPSAFGGRRLAVAGKGRIRRRIWCTYITGCKGLGCLQRLCVYACRVRGGAAFALSLTVEGRSCLFLLRVIPVDSTSEVNALGAHFSVFPLAPPKWTFSRVFIAPTPSDCFSRASSGFGSAQ